MRIHRDRSRRIFRRRNAWAGCLPWLTTLCLLFAVAFLARNQLREWFLNWFTPPVEFASLSDAQTAYDTGNLERSIAYAQSVYDNDASDINALVLLARSLVYYSYADLNQDAAREQALALTTAAIEETPYNMQVLGIHAFVLQANGFSEDAQRIALRVIRHEPESITARLALALSYASQGIFEAALRDGLRAVEIADASAPNWRADAYRVVAIAYSDLGQYTEAIETVEIAITHHRRLLALHFERALYAQQLGDMDSATAYYFNVIAFDETNAKARFRLCEISSLLGERDAAVDWCLQVTDAVPGWSEGWYQLGREYYLKGDWAQAQEALGRCSMLQVAQDMPIEERRFECWYIQGQAAEVLRDCETLIPLYEEYQTMALEADLAQSWVYPDGVPTVCASATAVPED